MEIFIAGFMIGSALVWLSRLVLTMRWDARALALLPVFVILIAVGLVITGHPAAGTVVALGLGGAAAQIVFLFIGYVMFMRRRIDR